MAVAAATSGECSWGAAAMRARFFRSYVAGVDDARVAFLRVARSGSFMEVWLDAFCFGRKTWLHVCCGAELWCLCRLAWVSWHESIMCAGSV